MRVLCIRISSLGDVVLQTAFLSWLKISRPSWQIDFLTASEFVPLIEGHPHVDNVLAMPRFKGLKGLWLLYQYCQNDLTSYDLVIDLHGTTRSFFIRKFLYKAKTLVIPKYRFRRFLLTTFRINTMKKLPSIHARHMQILGKNLGINYDEKKLKQELVAVFHEPSIGLTSLMRGGALGYAKPYIVISPVASFATKRWPIEYYKELIIKILQDKLFDQLDVIILGGPKDNYMTSLKELESGPQGRVKYNQGKFSLKETMLYLQHCQFCIGNDSGLNHIAEAYGRPVITLFGPTHEDFGFRAHLPMSKNLSVPVWCRPCSTTGKGQCFRGEQFCFTKLTPDLVYNQMRLLARELGHV